MRAGLPSMESSMSSRCGPTVEKPADLTKYNDFYDLGGLGRIFNILLAPIYDGRDV